MTQMTLSDKEYHQWVAVARSAHDPEPSNEPKHCSG